MSSYSEPVGKPWALCNPVLHVQMSILSCRHEAIKQQAQTCQLSGTLGALHTSEIGKYIQTQRYRGVLAKPKVLVLG